MSEWMLWVVSTLYGYAAIDLMLHDKEWLGLTFACYAIANMALIFVARNGG